MQYLIERPGAVTLLYAVYLPFAGAMLHALVRRNGEPRSWTRFDAQQSFAASSGPSSTPWRSNSVLPSVY